MAKIQQIMFLFIFYGHFFLAVKAPFPKAVSETVPKLLETHPQHRAHAPKASAVDSQKAISLHNVHEKMYRPADIIDTV